MKLNHEMILPVIFHMTVYFILCNAFRNSIFERFHMSCADEIKS